MERKNREQGWILVEAMIALTVLTVGVLGFMFSFQANFRATREMGNRDLAQLALESAAETLKAADFGTLYTNYQGMSLPAPGLVDPDGNPAVVQVQFHVNERIFPSEFGPVQDIDGDGVMNTEDASANYAMLPAQLTLTFLMNYGPETKHQYLIIGPQ